MLIGGLGADTFVFGYGKKFSKKLKSDRVVDFSGFGDVLVFDRKTFGMRLQFESINDSYERAFKASDSSKTLVYDYETGVLYFNQNRSLPGLGKGGVIATFDNTLAGEVTISASDCRMGSATV